MTEPPAQSDSADGSAANMDWELRMSARLHEIADTMNDAADHDELHAAAALLAHDESARGREYVGRWLAALISRHVYPRRVASPGGQAWTPPTDPESNPARRTP